MRADYPGKEDQIDFKSVSAYRVADGMKYYQYTAVDELAEAVQVVYPPNPLPMEFREEVDDCPDINKRKRSPRTNGRTL